MTKLKLRDFVRPIGKPLSTKGGRGIYPTVYVDVSTQTCGPRLRRDLMVAIPDFPVRESCMVKVKTPYVFDPDQAALAAAQWGSDGDQPVDRPWLKSWYFPADAFDPWPRKQPAGLCCWHCTCEFDWAPFPLPRSRDAAHGRWRVLAGRFCGPSCAKAYAKYSGLYINLSEVFGWIDEIAATYFGYRTAKGHTAVTPIAPKKELLRKFCGPKGLTIEQFRTLIAHGRTLNLLDPGFITIKQVVEAEDTIARMKLVKSSTCPVHRENPDDIKTIEDMVKVRRPVFGGRGARPISAFFGKKEPAEIQQ